MAGAYYNEIDLYAAEWLRNLMAAGLIAQGEVDTRSIEDVSPDDLKSFTQCHFFAGIGVWSYALRRAGWPDDFPVWTGSCPCQPFSSAGAGAGFADERHLWPAFHHLIEIRRPAIVFGEQVASKDADPWIDLVCADLESLGYAFGAVPFPSAGIGSPHIRDRAYWVAHASCSGRGEGGLHLIGGSKAHGERENDQLADVRTPLRLADTTRGGQRILGCPVEPGEIRHANGGGNAPSGLANTASEGRRSERSDSHASHGPEAFQGGQAESGRCSAAGGGLADPNSNGCDQTGERQPAARNDGAVGDGCTTAGATAAGPVNGLWRDADWLFCRDGKWRPVEPGTFPLAHGAPARVGRLRAYGNAINAEAAVEFIRAAKAALGI